MPFQPVEGGVQHVLALAEELRELAVPPAQDLLQGLDAPAQPPHPLLVAVVEQQKGMDRQPQAGLELLALVLGAPQALGGLAVEGVVAQRAAELLGGAVEVAAAEEEAAVQLVIGRVRQVLGLRHLDALEGAGVLPLLGVEVGEAEEVGGVEGVAPEPLAQDVAQAARARPLELLLELADLGEAELDAEVLGLQPEGQQQEVGRLFIAGGVAEAPRQVAQLLDLGVRRRALRIGHAPRFLLCRMGGKG